VVAWLRALEGRFDTVVLTVKGAEHAHVERVHGARILRVPVGTGTPASRHDAFDRAVRRQVASDTWDLVHFLDPISGRALCETQEAHGAALIYEPAGLPSRDLPATDPAWGPDRRGRIRLRRWEISCLARADAVLAPTPSLGDYALSVGVAPDRLHLLPEPVALHEVPAAPGATRVRVLFAGSARPHDGLDTLLDALARVRPAGSIGACLVGMAPDEEASCVARAEERGLGPGAVTFSRTWPAPSATAEDVVAFPLAAVEYNTGAGRLVPGLAEALGRGLPAISSDLPLLRGQVPDTAGLFHRPGDSRGMASALGRLASDGQLRARLSAGAREAARTRHAPEGAAQRLLACYARVLAGA
jgi:glycosyltransferase involved in cell wall biosynthesis